MDSAGKAFLGKGWAFPVQPSQAGEVALSEYDEDVRQAIHIILGTALGERVMRPDFGVGLQNLVFEPINTTTRELVRHRVEQALITWEPRIDSLEIAVNSDMNERNKLIIEIRYKVRATNTFYNLVYPFYLIEGEVP